MTNKDGSRNGDPLNLVVVGGLDDAFPAFARRGWRPTEQKWSGSIKKTVTSFFAGERYAYSPVSNLYMLGRAQDLALQKARDNIHKWEGWLAAEPTLFRCSVSCRRSRKSGFCWRAYFCEKPVLVLHLCRSCGSMPSTAA